MNKNNLGDVLCFLRERRGLGLREIGKLSNIDHAYIHRLETGEKTKPSYDLLKKYFKVLKLTRREIEILNMIYNARHIDSMLIIHAIKDKSISVDLISMASQFKFDHLNPEFVFSRARLALKVVNRVME